jgi:ribonuclease D
MSVSQLPPAAYIDNNKDLRALVKQLSTEPLLALDTESNSMHAYRGRVCLIQLSTRTHDYIVDPLVIEDMQPFGELLLNPDIEKIFHAAEYDLICMQRDFDFGIINVFDTMLAARVLGIPSVGLADMLRDHFGVTVDKSHQLDDWGQRPLPQDSLLYAQMDTHYLPGLRDALQERLIKAGHIDEAQEIFTDLMLIDVEEKVFDPHGFWKIGRPRALNRREMAYLRELYLVRETIAQEEDVPPYKVMTNKAMVRLAQNPPTNFTDLFDLKELGAYYVREYGDDILEALERAESSKPPRPPRVERRQPAVVERYSALHAWRKETAELRAVDSSLVLPKQVLWSIAEQLPTTMTALAQINGMGQWRLDMYGEAILDVIHQMNGSS